MTEEQYSEFVKFKESFKQKIKKWNQASPTLMQLQKDAAKQAKTPEYSFETPIVYNRAFDEITKDDEIKLIVLGDNPGKDEQLLKNNKYLVGQAGKLAEGFFRKNPELKIDFRKNVLILNKTPIHSAKTTQLKSIIKNGGKNVYSLFMDTQTWMAEQTAYLSKIMNVPIWLVGYTELKPKGIFETYREVLKKNADWEKLFVFQHFSMNRFSIDLNNFMKENPELSLPEALSLLSEIHKSEIFK